MIVPLFWSWGWHLNYGSDFALDWFAAICCCVFLHTSLFPCTCIAVSHSWVWHCIFLPFVIVWWMPDCGPCVFFQLPWYCLLLLSGFYVTETFVQFALEHVSCHCDTKGHYCLDLPILVLNVVRWEEASSSLWCQYRFLQLHTVNMQASASMWEMLSGVQKL